MTGYQPKLSVMATAFQIGVSVFRVAAFAYAALSLGRDHGQLGLLLFVGYLPFLGFFDLLILSFARLSVMRNSAWIEKARPLRQLFALITLLGIIVVALLALNDNVNSIVVLLVCCLLGSMGYIWEGWLASPAHAIAFATIEISLLLIVVVGHHTGLLPIMALPLCFVSFSVARLLALVLPGLDQSTPTVPRSENVHPASYIGFSLGQQLVGALSAALPALYAHYTKDLSQLPSQLALFRIMQSMGAVASLAVNAVGSRIFFQKAAWEVEKIGRILHLLRRYGQSIDIFFAGILVIFYVNQTSFLFAIIPFAILIAISNFASSYFINVGRPRHTFMLQIIVLFISLSAVGFINHQHFIFYGFLLIFLLSSMLHMRQMSLGNLPLVGQGRV